MCQRANGRLDFLPLRRLPTVRQEPVSAMPASHASPSRERAAIRSVSLLLFVGLPLMTASSGAGQTPPQLGGASLDEVIGAMTVEEKVSLLVGMGMNLPFDIPGLPRPSPEDRAVPEKVPGAAGRTHAIERLGIPSITLADGPAGIRIDPTREGDARTYHATAFPVATLLSSSWDPALAETVGAAIGRQVREYGADVLLAPGMNLHRNPLGGRNFEYYSEDPLLNGRMAAGFVNGVESEGVGTSLKHFAVNSQEFNRLKSNSIVGQRALRELYLRGFEIAVKEAQPWTVMSAYNLVNGTYAPQDRDLLTTILRDEWGFEGFVMTDWFAGDDPVAMMRAGNDVIMPGGVQQSAAIVAAVGSDELSEAQLEAEEAHRPPGNILMPAPPIPEMETEAALIRGAAARADVGLYSLGRNSGEGGDRGVEGDFDLTVAEVALIRDLSQGFRAEGKPFVVVLNVAGVTEVAGWRDAADAILLAWQPGQEAGNAIADVLSGAVNPSGKLPMSFPAQYTDVPSSRTFPGQVLPEYADQEQPAGFMAMLNPLPSQAVYEEGIFVGYRYYDTFDVEPAYPFGYGLSYTTFEYGDLELSEARFGGEITARVMVTNTGDVPGREVVQLYVSAPRGSLVKPEAELRAFAKTRLLQPGESQTLAFTLDGRSLASFDPDRSAWIAEAGEYEVRAAASSRDTRVRARFAVPETLVVEEAHDVMGPEVEIDLLRPTYD